MKFNSGDKNLQIGSLLKAAFHKFTASCADLLKRLNWVAARYGYCRIDPTTYDEYFYEGYTVGPDIVIENTKVIRELQPSDLCNDNYYKSLPQRHLKNLIEVWIANRKIKIQFKSTPQENPHEIHTEVLISKSLPTICNQHELTEVFFDFYKNKIPPFAYERVITLTKVADDNDEESSTQAMNMQLRSVFRSLDIAGIFPFANYQEWVLDLGEQRIEWDTVGHNKVYIKLLSILHFSTVLKASCLDKYYKSPPYRLYEKLYKAGLRFRQ